MWFPQFLPSPTLASKHVERSDSTCDEAYNLEGIDVFENEGRSEGEGEEGRHTA
jgi:hypothetical protein